MLTRVPMGTTTPIIPTADLRNLALLGHKGSGKTSLAEAMLFTAGHVPRLGRVEEGSTVCDFEPEARAHGCSVQASVAHVRWNGRKINIVDTPGDPNFVADLMHGVSV